MVENDFVPQTFREQTEPLVIILGILPGMEETSVTLTAKETATLHLKTAHAGDVGALSGPLKLWDFRS